MKIAHVLSKSGIASRRKCEEYVKKGLVKVNGQIETNVARTVNWEEDIVAYRDKILQKPNEVFIIMNKPVGYTVTAFDRLAKKTVYDLLPQRFVSSTRQAFTKQDRVFPIGRLDKDTSGLLLFTNNGDVSNQLIHPKFGVSKFYEARLDRAWDSKDGGNILKGFRAKDGRIKVESFRPLTKRIIKVEVKEGKYRHIRRLFKKFGYKVMDLHRIQFGPLVLHKLPPGQVQILTKSDVDKLKKAAGMTPEKKPKAKRAKPRHRKTTD